MIHSTVSLVTILLMGLSLQACQSAKLSHVMVGEQIATGSDLVVVKVFRKGQQVKTEKGMGLRIGDTITTDESSSAVIEFSPQVQVFLTPGTQVQIGTLTLKFGKVLVIIKEKLKKVFEVKTEDVTAGPTSTVFSVAKKAGGPTTVAVINGTVKLNSPVHVWPEVRLERQKQAITYRGKRPEIEPVPQAEFNSVVAWANRSEALVRPGQPTVLVPDVMLLPKETAKSLIVKEGLRMGEIKPMISRPAKPIGTVVEQNPSAGARVGKGSVVDIGVEVEPVTLPDLRNKALPVAKQMLLNKGLVPGKINWKITGSVMAKRILAHRPPGGDVVPKGTKVHLDVEEESVVVPNLKGMTIEDARTILSSGRLKLSDWSDEITGTQPAKSILRQTPSAGERVKINTGVSLVIEAVSVVVPNVQGMPVEEARNVISRAQLGLGGHSEEITGTQPARKVLRQSPPAGERVKLNTPVSLVIEAVSVIVPDLRNMNEAAAVNRLSQNQLSSGRIDRQMTGQRPAGIVFHQMPEAGQRVRPGTQVSLVVEAESVVIPQITGLNQGQANNLLMQRKLRIGGVRQELRENAIEGAIIGQSPAPGQRVAPGTPVYFTIAISACRTPNLLGMTRNNAMSALRPCRMVIARVSERETNQTRPGIIIEQHPAPGMLVRKGERVEIVVAKKLIRWCIMPNVTGMRIQDAEREVIRMGLVPRVVNPRYGGVEQVTHQNPRPGFKLHCGDVVDLTTMRVVQ
jgi:beta-lactam-binding protein with PASTA domain